MAKLYKISDWCPGLPDVYFHCPGCECDHGVWTQKTENNNVVWAFNGDMDKPTFAPSILVRCPRGDDGEERCHSFVTDGKIRYLGDCSHKLAGQIMELPEVDYEENN